MAANLSPTPEPRIPPTQTFIEIQPTVVPTSTPIFDSPTKTATVDTYISTPILKQIGNYGGSLTVPTEVWFENLDPHMESSDG